MSGSTIIPVILCGGIGTRLWPRSRAAKPKPFLPLVGDTTPFAATLKRCSPAAGFAAPIIVAGELHAPHVATQLGDAGAAIILEPVGRSTAAAIALAAHRVDEDAIMLVCPSDHHIGDPTAFTEAAHRAAELAAAGWLVAIGVEALSPETGYGYLKQGEAIGPHGHRVAQFVEKPDRDRAIGYLAEGGFAWNSGIFAFRAADYLAELARYRPALAEHAATAARQGISYGPIFHPHYASFAAIESESVDYAVMENTDRAAMVTAAMAWSDIGNWQAVQAARGHDPAGNSCSGPVDLVDCRNVLVDSDGPRVSVIGLQDVIIVVDGDEILVTRADGSGGVGKLPGVSASA